MLKEANILFWLAAAVLLCGIVSVNRASGAESGNSAGVSSVFREALSAEKRDNDIDKAISLYQQVVDEAAGDEEITARALMQMAGCYEKKGSINEAVKCCRRIVSDCKSEVTAVKKAEAKLKSLEPRMTAEAAPAAEVKSIEPEVKKEILHDKVLPGSAWKHISGVVCSNYAEAAGNGKRYVAKVYGITGDGFLCSGGAAVFKNNTAADVAAGQEVLLDGFPTSNVVAVSETGARLQSNSKPDGKIYAAADAVIEAGKVRCFGWQSGESSKLTAVNELYEVSMQGGQGGKAVESLFLVLPAGMGVIEPNEPYTNEVKLEDAVVYEWKKEASESAPNQLVVKTGKPGLQSVINKRGFGATFILKNGVYTEPIVITKPITLRGESLEGCRFEIVGDKPAIQVNNPHEGQVVIENLTINWHLEKAGQDDVDYAALDMVTGTTTINGCFVENTTDETLAPAAILNRGSATLNLTNTQIEGPFGSAVFINKSTKAVITDCVINRSVYHGIAIDDFVKAEIQRNIITNCGSSGIESYGFFITVRDNLIEHNRSGLSVSGGSQGTVDNNIFVKNSTGIDAVWSGTVKISNNIIAESESTGIFFGLGKLTIDNNIFLKNKTGLMFFGSGENNQNKLGLNTYWSNKKVNEGFKYVSRHIVGLYGDFIGSSYKLKDGCEAAKEKQGLSDIEVMEKILSKRNESGVNDRITKGAAEMDEKKDEE